MIRTVINVSTGEVTEVPQVFVSNQDKSESMFIDEGSKIPEGFALTDYNTFVPKVNPQELVSTLLVEIQKTLDQYAQSWGYDDIKSAVTYADEPAVPKFQNEGRLLRAWRSLVWEQAAEILAHVESGQSPIPTKEEVLNSLPSAPVRP